MGCANSEQECWGASKKHLWHLCFIIVCNNVSTDQLDRFLKWVILIKN